MIKKLILPILLLLAGCSQNMYTQGRKLVEQGEYDRAINVFYKNIAADPKSGETWRELGIAFYKKGDLIKAEDALKQAGNIQPDPMASLYSGMIYEKQNEFDKAIDAYTYSLSLEPGGKVKNLIRAHLDRLVTEKVKREVSQALKNESKIDASTIPSNTIAVVNFDGSHLPPEMAPIGEGLAEFTAADLTKVKSLQVVDRVKIDAIMNELKLSSSQYADPATAPRMGRLLGSRNIITGTLLGVGDKGIRLDGAVVNTTDGSARVTPAVEGDMAEFFNVQKQFVFNVIDDMGITLSPEERDAIQKVPTESYLAFMAYCRGLNYRSRGLDGQARQEFQEAASLDKSFTAAKEQFQTLSLAPSLTGGVGQAVEQFESVVTSEAVQEQLTTELGQRLTDIVLNSGFIPSFGARRPDLMPPIIGTTGAVLIVGDLDGK